MSIEVGRIYRTPFEPAGLFRVLEIEPGREGWDETAFGVYVGDHPAGYRDGSYGRYFSKELRDQSCRHCEMVPQQPAANLKGATVTLAKLLEDRLRAAVGNPTPSDYNYLADVLAIVAQDLGIPSDRQPLYEVPEYIQATAEYFRETARKL